MQKVLRDDDEGLCCFQKEVYFALPPVIARSSTVSVCA